jgi:hypothetical protein
MSARTLASAFCLAALIVPASAREAISAAARAWLADVVERVEATASLAAAAPGTRRARTVDVHMRIATDGTVLEVRLGQTAVPGPTEKRLQSAVATAGPFDPPPRELLASDGSTELSFPLRLPDPRR